MHENNDSRRMHNLRNFPLLILPQLQDINPCVSDSLRLRTGIYPCKTVRYIALTLLFFVWGILSAKQILLAGETLTGATQDAIVEITATDGMTTHYGQITYLQGQRIFLRRALCCMANIFRKRFVPDNCGQ